MQIGGTRIRVIGSVASIVAAVAMMPATSASSGSAPGIEWVRDIPEALELAAGSGRPVLVDVFADWCRPCHVMERETFGNSEVSGAMAGFVPLKIDADENDPFAVRYGVGTLPTTLFLDASGREITKIVGLVGPYEMREIMAEVRDGYGEYLDQLARPHDPVAVEAVASYLFGLGNVETAVRHLRMCVTLLRGSNADRQRVEEVELKLAQVQFAAGDTRGAVALMERLADSADDDMVRAWALAGMVKIDIQRGRRIEAERSLTRLRQDHPEIARTLDAGL